MYSEINNFPKFMEELVKKMSMDYIAKRHGESMLKLSDAYLSQLLLVIPEGEDAPPDDGTRPSMRLWGQRIHDSFRAGSLTVDQQDRSMISTAYFDHPSVEEGREGDVLDWFQYGTAPHYIPHSETGVSFWWGSPLRWQAHKPPEPGRRGSKVQNAWGKSTIDRGYWARPYGDFLSEAYLTFSPSEAEAVDAMYSNTLTDALQSQYLRRGNG